MDEHVETRVRLIGGGLQLTLLGIAVLEYEFVGVVAVFAGTLVTLGGLV